MAKPPTPQSASSVPAASGARRPSAASLAKLDRQIVAQLNERARLAQERGPAASLDAEAGDAAVIDAALAASAGPLPAAAVRAIFRELLGGIRAAAEPVRVAYLGPEYTYSHLAAIARFSQSAELVPVATIASVFEEVARGHAQFGVAPIENSTDGRVADALECFSKIGRDPAGAAKVEFAGAPSAAAAVQICGEVPLRIHHCLLGRGPRGAIRRVCSKPQALSQCRNWLNAHIPAAKLESAASSAEAAALAAAEPEVAAIASEQAAVNHGLEVLARNIEDNPDNVTRFAIIGSAPAGRTGKDKTAVVFEAPHEPGALADAMAIFKRQKLNLTWIESFPIPGARGRYLFFLEFQGHAADLRVKRALGSLARRSLRLTVLGSYAEADVVG